MFLTRILASVGDKLAVLVLQAPNRWLCVAGVVVDRHRRVSVAVGRVHAARDEPAELESVGDPDPLRKTVRPLARCAFDCQLGRDGR